MPSRNRILFLRAKTRGQSMVEYLLLAAIAVALLAVPFGNNSSVLEFLLSSVQIAYAKFLSAISIPQ